MKGFFILVMALMQVCCIAQNKPGTSFYGETNANTGLCPKRSNALSEQDVINLITEMLGRYGIKNRYIIMNCTEVENCQAAIYEGKPYILYNPNFLGSVKKLNFKNADLPIQEKDWATLTVLAHELGHHVNNHLINPLPNASQWDMELEADETAGFIIQLMGGTLNDAQIAFNNIPEQGTYTHPGRQKRMNAIAKGWNDAKSKYSGSTITPVKTEKLFDIDDNIYQTIKIGEQQWMQSNLAVTTFRNGENIRQAMTEQEWKEAAYTRKPAYFSYYYETPEGRKYAILYNWYAVNDPRGLAPKGWHIPSVKDWIQLIDYLGGEENAGKRLKSTFGWLNEGNGINDSEFFGYPNHSRHSDGTYTDRTSFAAWWSNSDGAFRMNAYSYHLYHNQDKVLRQMREKGSGLAVRCVKD